METLKEFKDRTNYVYQKLNIYEPFYTNPNLEYKVSREGHFKAFYGDTIVFLLNDKIKQQLGLIQKKLYENCSHLLADSLDSDTFHLTLHDLNNGNEENALYERMTVSEHKAHDILEMLGNDRIHLRFIRIFNMVNTSVVCCFEPVSESDQYKLMTLYQLFQDIVPLNYPLTPHITLAYYRPMIMPIEDVEDLQATFDELNQQLSIELELSLSQLVYQQFYDMNHYMTRE